MSKPLKKVSINKTTYDIVGKPRIFSLSGSALIEESDIFYDSLIYKLSLIPASEKKKSTYDPLEIASTLMNNKCRLYTLCSNNFTRSTDITYVNVTAYPSLVTINNYDGSLVNISEMQYIP